MDKTPSRKLVEEITSNRPQQANFKLPETIERSAFSQESQEVLEHFGIEAPELLNNFCLALEDALIASVKAYEKLKLEISVHESLNKRQQSND